MKIGKEMVFGKRENYEIVRYNYYFSSRKEMENFKLHENERLIGRSYYTGDQMYPCYIQVEAIRAIKSKHIYDSESYGAFIKNLQLVQKNFNYSNEWYNNWIDYVNKIGYDEAESLIELLNDFYVSGVWRAISDEIY